MESRKRFAREDLELFGYHTAKLPALPALWLQLEERELESEDTFFLDGQIPENEKATLAVVGVFEVVEGRNHCSGQIAPLGLEPSLLFGVLAQLGDEFGDQDEIWVLEKFLVRVDSAADFELNDGRRVKWSPVFSLRQSHTARLGLLSYPKFVIVAAHHGDGGVWNLTTEEGKNQTECPGQNQVRGQGGNQEVTKKGRAVRI